ncbi:MAG: TIGR00159 family protein [Planctomycetes bacterium]|nr:TIGR00159 family protein [Planctomycetota bacterium]
MNDVLNYLGGLRQTFQPKDALEIAIMAVLIYFAYRSLRGTRGARVIRGFIFVLLTSFVLLRIFTDYLRMERLNYLYGLVVPWLLVLAVVVFQPELRRSLMRLGENPLLRLFLRQGASAFVDRIVRAVSTLSRNRVGAIIAVERDSRLAALAESGVALDAELTSELLTTLFWPGSPLHDMGVVICGGRIAAAGCEFPLSHQTILDPHFGTRHRAAVGLTEESDAVVIVVSEETGNISLAEGGQLETPLTPEALRLRLLELLRAAASSEPDAGASGYVRTCPAAPAAGSGDPAPDDADASDTERP